MTSPLWTAPIETDAERVDILLTEVERLRRLLVHRDAEIAHLRDALAARPVPLHRLLLVAASSLMTLAVGLADGTDCRRCGHPRYLHRHHRPGTDCSCGCRAWTLWGRRRG